MIPVFNSLLVEIFDFLLPRNLADSQPAERVAPPNAQGNLT